MTGLLLSWCLLVAAFRLVFAVVVVVLAAVSLLLVLRVFVFAVGAVFFALQK